MSLRNSVARRPFCSGGGRRVSSQGRCTLHVHSAIVARWAMHSRFGCKAATLRLMSEWLTSVAATTGYDTRQARVLAVQLGAAESRCELELEFASLSDMETFWSLLPQAEHKAWLEQLAPYVDGSANSWTTLQLYSAEHAEKKPPAEQPLTRTAGGLLVPLSSNSLGEVPGPEVELDWKGDPIQRRPGDKLPRIL